MAGLAKGGTIGAAMFDLPEAIRPPARRWVYQVVVSNNAVGVVDIREAGSVIAQAGSNVHFSLEGVSFSLDP